MDPDVQSFAFVATIIVGMVGSLSLIGIVSWKILTGGTRKTQRAVTAAEDERLERLQQSVDAIAIEVERIAEAQRFTAKLMSERGEQQSLPS